MTNKINSLIGFLVITLVLTYVAIASKKISDDVAAISSKTSAISTITARNKTHQ